MGIDISKENEIDVEKSLKQVLNAFRKEFPLLTRNHTTRTNLNSSHRSHSLETFQQRQWQCQLCQSLNQFNLQLCSKCGSVKVNVYIPILDHLSQSNNNLKESNEKEEISARRSILIVHKEKVDENLVLKHTENLLRKCSLTNQLFEDETFPPTSQSIFINSQSFSQTTLDLLPDQQNSFYSNNQIIWLRPNEIIPPDWNQNNNLSWTLYRDPKPNDVIQGALGDCWFITALSVLAEEPEYLMKVLTTKEYNEQGIYYVRLCKDGEWTQVLVDDRLPCTMNKKLAYSQSHRKQLWVPLIEKALAKLNGSYESIIAGRCCEGLSIVTGSPCETLFFENVIHQNEKDKIWLKLFNSRKEKFLMCAMCSNSNIDKTLFEHVGLLNNHAYSLQDVQQSNDSNIKLIKLRNPWGGTFRWNGDWSDKSPLWNQYPDLKKDCLKEKHRRKDGVFWMPFESFLTYFECVDICKIRSNWYEVRDSGNFYPHIDMMQAYFLHIHQTTHLDLTLFRKISKHLRIQRSEVSLCIAIVNIQQQSTGNLRIYSIPIVTQRGQHKFVSTDGCLQKGTYVILPLLFNPINKYIDNTLFNLAIHSSCAIDLEKISIPLTIQREFLIKLCLFYGEKVENKEPMANVNIYELKTYWDGLILLVENLHLTKYVHFHFRCTLSQNAYISRKDSNHQLFDVIPSMHRQIIVMISRKNASHSFTIGHDFQYNLSSQKFIKNSNLIKIQHWPKIDESLTSEDIHLPQPISSNKQS